MVWASSERWCKLLGSFRQCCPRKNPTVFVTLRLQFWSYCYRLWVGNGIVAEAFAQEEHDAFAPLQEYLEWATAVTVGEVPREVRRLHFVTPTLAGDSAKQSTNTTMTAGRVRECVRVRARARACAAC